MDTAIFFRLATLLAVTALLLLGGCDTTEPDPDPPDEGPYPSLAENAPFPVGVAIKTEQLAKSDYREVITHAFNSITAEYEMKARTIWDGPETYDWSATDQLVTFAAAHDMRVHGHALVWHTSTPGFLNAWTGSDEEFERLVREYIEAVLTRYKGKIASWDVVNEAFADGNGLLRNTPFREHMGTDYLARLFQYARAADPDMLLFYNDYGTTYDERKRNAMLTMIDDFQSRGIPIDGVGLQVHIRVDSPSLREIGETIDAIVDRGLRVHLSELDVQINRHGDLDAPTEERLQAQEERVRQLVELYLERVPSELQHGISWWGVRDPDTWLIEFLGRPEWPLLFDEAFQPKPAYFGFLEALRASG